MIQILAKDTERQLGMLKVKRKKIANESHRGVLAGYRCNRGSPIQ